MHKYIVTAANMGGIYARLIGIVGVADTRLMNEGRTLKL